VTLIGSSTNLLVSGMLIELGEEGFSFFQFAIPGMVLAGVGIFYVIFACPRLLPEHALLASTIAGGGRQFMADLNVREGSKFHGMQPRAGFFPDLKDMTVRVVIRDHESFFPSFDDSFVLEDRDTIVVAATRSIGRSL